ncbi:MAG: type II toxin-antitoxin system HicB family antitoxin, partial [Acidimicrobiales bacterium]
RSCDMMDAMRTYSVVIERDDDGSYFAVVPALPGCFTHGATLEVSGAGRRGHCRPPRRAGRRWRADPRGGRPADRRDRHSRGLTPQARNPQSTGENEPS